MAGEGRGGGGPASCGQERVTGFDEGGRGNQDGPPAHKLKCIDTSMP